MTVLGPWEVTTPLIKPAASQKAMMLTVYPDRATAEARHRSLFCPLFNLFGQMALTIFYILVDTNPLFDYSWYPKILENLSLGLVLWVRHLFLQN